MDSVYTDGGGGEDTDLSLHDPSMNTPTGRTGQVSSDAYAWGFVVVAVGLLWVIGRGFRSVNS